MNKQIVFDTVVDVLCRLYDDAGSGESMSIDQIQEASRKILQTQVSIGRIEICLRDLVNSDFVCVIYTSDNYTYYSSKTQLYEDWLENQDSGKIEATVSEWSPVKVENYENIVQMTEGLADKLDQENGYKSEHSLEADYTIDQFKLFAKSLREGKGTIIRQALTIIRAIFGRLQVIFDKATRIGKLVAQIIALLNMFH